jgi:hypothetical protein
MRQGVLVGCAWVLPKGTQSTSNGATIMQVKLLSTAVTKTNKAGQVVAANPQKGPTCWYYAARLIRESYGRTYSNLNDIPAHLQGERDIEARISNLRKIETRIDSLIGEEGLRQQMVSKTSPLPDTLLDKLHHELKEMFPTQKQWQQVLSKFLIEPVSEDAFIDLVPIPPISKQFVNYISRTAPRMILMELTDFEDETLLKKYGFKPYPFDSNGVVDAINKGVLLLASGHYSPGDGAHAKASVIQYTTPTGAQSALDVYRVEQYEMGGHAIVINGVGLGDTLQLMFRDPQYPQLQFMIPYPDFAQRAAEKCQLMRLT